MISPDDYDFLARLLLDRSGLSLGPGKEYLLEARLIPLAQSQGLAGIAELTRNVRQNPHGNMAQGVVEAMTTNETLFFRDKTPFDELRDQILPPLLEGRRLTKQLRIWSAAASTGQESYSLAMLLADSFPQLKDWRVEIVGTDLSRQALARAEEGLYSQFEVQRGLPIQLLVKHFQQDSGGWRVKPALRNWVRFLPLNLLDSFRHLGRFDLIFCRNVLIYFDNPVKKQILDRMAQLLPPDGSLFLGAAETVLGVTDTLERTRNMKSAVYHLRSHSPASTLQPVVSVR